MTETQKEFIQWVIWRDGIALVFLMVAWVSLGFLAGWIFKNAKELSAIPLAAMVVASFLSAQNILGIVKSKTAPHAYLNSYWNTGEVKPIE